jgi:hypothetical protein
VADLLVACRCGAEVPVAETKGGRCRTCQADQACASDRADLVRLWRKREGYRRRGVPVAHADEQAGRLRQRMERKCQAIEPDPDKAHELSNRQARLAGEARGRILLPQEA